MTDKKIVTHVSPKTAKDIANCMCSQLPITIKYYSSVEEVFPLLSDPTYHTDFVCISIDMFYQRADNLDMFDIIHTLDTLIKSTVCRKEKGTRPQHRSTKIYVIVDETTNPVLIKQVMAFPAVVSIGWILTKQEEMEVTQTYINNLINGNYANHPLVTELLKPKTIKPKKNKDTITLTVRQAQILQIIQERGASNKIIAKMLNLSESTVKLHVGAILKKYGVRNRTQLCVFSKDQIS